MTSHEKLQKGEAAVYGRVTGHFHMDEAQRKKARKDLMEMIEMYENSNPNRQTDNSESGDNP